MIRGRREGGKEGGKEGEEGKGEVRGEGGEGRREDKKWKMKNTLFPHPNVGLTHK
jgi:hypothetical protein